MAIELIAKIKPKNNQSFAMVDAEDVEMPDGSRLSDFMKVLSKSVSAVPLTQEDYNKLVADGTVDTDTIYFIVVGDDV